MPDAIEQELIHGAHGWCQHSERQFGGTVMNQTEFVALAEKPDEIYDRVSPILMAS